MESRQMTFLLIKKRIYINWFLFSSQLALTCFEHLQGLQGHFHNIVPPISPVYFKNEWHISGTPVFVLNSGMVQDTWFIYNCIFLFLLYIKKAHNNFGFNSHHKLRILRRQAFPLFSFDFINCFYRSICFSHPNFHPEQFLQVFNSIEYFYFVSDFQFFWDS